MPYNPTTDLVGLWRSVSGGVEKAQMPGVDFVVQAMTRAGLMRTVTSQTAPTTNQSITAWFQPANPSYASEGTLFLWDPNLSMYVPATPELFHGGSSGGGGGGGGDGGTGGSDMATISPTPPANPGTGQQWWDGKAMHVWDGDSWEIVGAGGPVPTTTGVFSLVQSQQLTIAASSGTTYTQTPWVSTPTIDTMNAYDNVTKKWTPNKAGIYMVYILGVAATPAGGAYSQAVLKNDQGVFNWSTPVQTVCIFDQQAPAVSTSGIWNATGAVTMNGTTDYLRHWTFSTTGTVYLPTTATPTWAVVALP